jgi:hypothetical protein
MAEYGQITVTIASGQSLSSQADIGPYRLAAIVMPAAWDAANLTFAVAADDETQGGQQATTFQPLYNDAGTETSATAAASRVIGVDNVAGALAACRYIKIRSGTVGVPVNQTATRTLTLLLKP